MGFFREKGMAYGLLGYGMAYKSESSPTSLVDQKSYGIMGYLLRMLTVDGKNFRELYHDGSDGKVPCESSGGIGSTMHCSS